MMTGVARVGFSPNFDSSKWYHHTVTYDSVKDVLKWRVNERDTGAKFHDRTYNDVQVRAFNQVAVGYQSRPPVYGRWAEIYVDNISIVPEPPRRHVPPLPPEPPPPPQPKKSIIDEIKSMIRLTLCFMENLH